MEEIRLALAQSGPVDEARDHIFSAVLRTETAVAAEAKALELLGAADVDDELELPELDELESELFDGELPEQADGEPELDAQDQQPPSKERRMHTLLHMRPLEKIRTAMLGDKYDRSILIRDSNKTVCMATVKSPKIREDEAVAYSANRALALEVITYISNRRDWIKLYSVKLNLVMNPKTPMARSLTLLAHLNQMDVQKVARSRNIPSALATAAKRKIQARR
jgi:hypothetical protein